MKLKCRFIISIVVVVFAMSLAAQAGGLNCGPSKCLSNPKPKLGPQKQSQGASIAQGQLNCGIGFSKQSQKDAVVAGQEQSLNIGKGCKTKTRYQAQGLVLCAKEKQTKCGIVKQGQGQEVGAEQSQKQGKNGGQSQYEEAGLLNAQGQAGIGSGKQKQKSGYATGQTQDSPGKSQSQGAFGTASQNQQFKGVGAQVQVQGGSSWQSQSQ